MKIYKALNNLFKILILSFVIVFVFLSISYTNYIYSNQYKDFLKSFDNYIELVTKLNIFYEYHNYKKYNLINESEITLNNIKESFLEIFNSYNERNILISNIVFSNNDIIVCNLLNGNFKEIKEDTKSFNFETPKNIFTNQHLFFKKYFDFNSNSFIYIKIQNPFSKYYIKLLFLNLSIFLFGVFLYLLISNIFQNKISDIITPIEKLSYHLKNTDISNYRKFNVQNNFDEFEILNNSFNSMIEKIHIDYTSISNLNKLLYSVLNSSPNPIIAINENYNIIIFNNISENFFNLNIKNAINQNIFKCFDFMNNYIQDINSVITTNQEIQVYNQKIIHNKTNFVFDFSISPLLTQKGVIIIIRDLTERNKLNQTLAISNKMESIGRFSSQITHDINNVLGGLDALIQLFDMKENSRNKKLLNEFYKIINQGKNLSKSLLSFTRKKTPKFDKLNIIDEIKNSLILVKSLFPKNIEIITNYPETKSLYFIKGNKGQLEQILTNMLINSKDAIEEANRLEGFIKIDFNLIEISDSFDFLNLEKGKYIELIIQDNGIGIENDKINKIFDPLFTTKTEDKGTGLGLSIVYQIIKNHKGKILVQSTANRETTFKIYLKQYIEQNVKNNSYSI